jgi:hypothetical protein
LTKCGPRALTRFSSRNDPEKAPSAAAAEENAIEDRSLNEM